MPGGEGLAEQFHCLGGFSVTNQGLSHSDGGLGFLFGVEVLAGKAIAEMKSRDFIKAGGEGVVAFLHEQSLVLPHKGGRHRKQQERENQPEHHLTGEVWMRRTRMASGNPG